MTGRAAAAAVAAAVVVAAAAVVVVEHRVFHQFHVKSMKVMKW